MVELLKNIIARAWKIIISGSAAWDEIAAERLPVRQIRVQYVYPWIGLTIAAAFVFGLLYARNAMFENAILNTIITAISLLGGYFVSNFICLAYLKKIRPDLATKIQTETLVAYSYTVIILIELFTIIVPSLFFLRILSVFVAYVIWEGCRAIWRLKEDERGNIVLVFSLTIILVSIIINRIIHWMLPNI
jgi:hypothetical protein